MAAIANFGVIPGGRGALFTVKPASLRQYLNGDYKHTPVYTRQHLHNIHPKTSVISSASRWLP